MSANIMLPRPHRILEVKQETSQEYTFRVEAASGAQHGQFYQLSLPKIGEAPISVSAMGNGWLEFTIRRVGRLTSEVFRLRPGDRLFMRGPYGRPFPIDDFKHGDLVVIAGGTGVAPVRSTLRYFYEHPEEINNVYFLAGFRDAGSVLFREDLERFKTRFHTIYTLDREQVDGFETGFVTEHLGRIPFSTLGAYQVIIVGPPVMMQHTAQECIKRGVPEERIWVSFERRMSCAVGKCGHCKINETYVCLEGPVFNYIKARELWD